jgi:hypothetical protein
MAPRTPNISTSASPGTGTRAVAERLSLQLPLWHEKVRGLPNPLARSALFTVGNKTEPRAFYKQHKPIQTIAGYVITYKGEELRQDDEDVFLQLVHLARTHPLGERVEFAAYSLLKELDWSKSSEGYDRLRTTLDRLQGTGLRVTSQHPGEGGYQGALIRKYAWKDDADAPLTKWIVYLEPEIVNLFAPNSYTQVLWEQRLRLKSSAMAKYLHGYYATHENPYPLKVVTLQTLSGSRAKRLTDFRKGLRKALDLLVKERFLDSWNIDGSDLVHVVRTPRLSRPSAVRVSSSGADRP